MKVDGKSAPPARGANRWLVRLAQLAHQFNKTVVAALHRYLELSDLQQSDWLDRGIKAALNLQARAAQWGNFSPPLPKNCQPRTVS